MQRTVCALTGLMFLGLLLVGPVYLAVSNAEPAARCTVERGCDPRTDLRTDTRAQISDLR